MQSRAATKTLARGKEKEERICERISELFLNREKAMLASVVQTMFEDKKIYK